jgi:hypothetical protein
MVSAEQHLREGATALYVAASSIVLLSMVTAFLFS